MQFKIYLWNLLSLFNIMFTHAILSPHFIHLGRCAVFYCMHTPHLNSIPWMAIWILSRGLLLPHKSDPISFLLTRYLQHRNAH